MTLFASLNTGLTGLQSMMAALQTTGHNISNANTPGYNRQRVELQPQRPLEFSRLKLGRGVAVERIARVIDDSLNQRIRDSASTLAGLSVRSETLQRVEALTGALSGADLGSMLDRLFASLNDFSNNPEDLSTRTQALGNAQTVAETLNFLSTRAREFRAQLNGDVRITIDDINRLSGEIAALNRQVLRSENTTAAVGPANDLRDRRDLLLRELSGLVKVNAVETSTGEVNVFVGGTFLVFGGQSYDLAVQEDVDNGVEVVNPLFAQGSGALTLLDGKLKGLLESRDGLLRDLGQDLDVLANALAYEFNRVQSTGQGLERFHDLTSLHGVPDPTVALSIAGQATALSTADSITDSAFIGAADPTGRDIQVLAGANALETRRIVGFDSLTGTIFLDRVLPRAMGIGDPFQIKEVPFGIANGSFDIVLTNELTGVQESHTITVDLDRVPPADTTLNDILTQINAVPNVAASLTVDNQLRISSTVPEVRFSFANDTSGFLAAVGMNAFFSGSNAGDIAVEASLAQNPKFLSGAGSNSTGDNSNALAFVALRDAAVINGSSTFEDFYLGLIGDLAVQTAEFRDRFENQALVAQQLENQRERVSGVNLDEEAVHMIQFQRTFQAAARFVSVIDDALESLINGI